jgi:ABC-type antimicrobial peptide transport system permease subunit
MERRKDIGIMQTVGWKRHDINRQILSEVFLQTIIGFILGIMVSLIIMASIGSINVQTNLSEGLSNSPSISSAPLTISFIAVIEFLALIMIISASVSLFLGRRIAGMKPMANLRSL